MSQISSRGLENNAVDASKIANGSITNAKVASGIDAVKLADGSVSNTEFQYLDGVTSAIQTQFTNKISTSEKGANNGVATLDGGGKIPVAQLPNSVMEYQGVWNASTNTPTLADGVGSTGDVYRVSVAGSQDLGSGSISFGVGDYAIYNGTTWEKADTTDSVVSVNSQTGVVVLDTDDIAEGTNQYFTTERAQDAVGAALTDTASVDFTYNDAGNTISAAVLPAGVDHNALSNYVANEHVDHTSVAINTNANSGLSGGGTIAASRSLLIDPTNAPATTVASGDLVLVADISDSNNLKKVTAQSIADLNSVTPTTFNKETFTVSAGDVTNQYTDLAQVAKTGSIHFQVKGLGPLFEGASHDYSVSYTGGAGGKTRITWLNDLATGGNSAIVATDIIQAIYAY